MSRSRGKVNSEQIGKSGRQAQRLCMGALPPRYSLVLNPHVRERFTRCPSCNSTTRIRKLQLVVHVDHIDGPRLVLVNKTCRLCLLCDTLIVHQAELDPVMIASGFAPAPHKPDYVVLGTIDRRTWRHGFAGDVQLADIRGHMADFKKYLKIEVVPAHRERSNQTAG